MKYVVFFVLNGRICQFCQNIDFLGHFWTPEVSHKQKIRSLYMTLKIIFLNEIYGDSAQKKTAYFMFIHFLKTQN